VSIESPQSPHQYLREGSGRIGELAAVAIDDWVQIRFRDKRGAEYQLTGAVHSIIDSSSREEGVAVRVHVREYGLFEFTIYLQDGATVLDAEVLVRTADLDQHTITMDELKQLEVGCNPTFDDVDKSQLPEQEIPTNGRE
jgi:hypothetical protein